MHHDKDCGCRRHGHGGEGRIHHGGGGEERCRCGCGGHGEGRHHGGHFGRFGYRRFISREEVIARLEAYLKELQAEAKGVEERIAELKENQS